MWLELSDQLDEVIDKMNELINSKEKLTEGQGSFKVLANPARKRIKEIEKELESLEALKNELEDQLMRKLKGLEPLDLMVINIFLQEMDEERFILDADLYDNDNEELFNESILRLSDLKIILPAIRNREPGYIIVDDKELSMKMFGEDLVQ